MYHEVKISLQWFLDQEITGQAATVKDMLVDEAMKRMSNENVPISEYDLGKPVIICRDGYLVIHFYPHRGEDNEVPQV